MTRAELDATWEMVKDLEPLRPHELEHFTRVSFRTSPAGEKGWVREYVPRIVRTLLGELRAAPAISITGDIEWDEE